MQDKQPPAISIIIPTYQHAREIGACLESVFRQTFRDYEIIVVNDGSTDDTLDVLRPYLDRITFINQENRGGNAARNHGFQASSGVFLLFCDADIVMRPDFLATMYAALAATPQASYAYSSFKFGWKTFSLWPFDADRLRQLNFVHTTSLIRREHFPGFDESIRKLQDWDLWLTMLEAGHTGVWIDDLLFRMTPHKPQLGGISTWVPRFFYRIPWQRFGIRIRSVEKYLEAEAVIKKKHGLE